MSLTRSTNGFQTTPNRLPDGPQWTPAELARAGVLGRLQAWDGVAAYVTGSMPRPARLQHTGHHSGVPPCSATVHPQRAQSTATAPTCCCAWLPRLPAAYSCSSLVAVAPARRSGTGPPWLAPPLLLLLLPAFGQSWSQIRHR